jgi:predicted ATP-grasp superfamily ATP-dependent carboligase
MLSAFKYFVQTYNLPNDRYPVIQEYLSGKIAFAEVLYDRGNCRAISTTQPLRHKNIDTNNNATLRQTVKYENLIKIAKNFMDKLNWHGIAQLEFIPNAAGEYKLSEVNARPWGSIAVPVCAGLNYPWLWYLAALGQLDDAVYTTVKQVYCRWILGDGMAFLAFLKNGNFKSAVQILKPLANCYHDDFSLADPCVLLGESIDYLVKLFKSGGNTNPVTEGMIR